MKHYFLLALCVMMTLSASAKVQLPSLIGSHMIVEQNSEVRLWDSQGWS